MKKVLALIQLMKLWLENRYVFHTILKVWRGKVSLLGPSVLAELYESVTAIEQNRVHGIFIEAGCALGGSALVIAASRKRFQPFYVYDTFAGIPAPSERDGVDEWNRYQLIATKQAAGARGSQYYGYQSNLRQRVEQTFADFGMPIEQSHVCLVEGLFEDTLHVSEPVAFAHIDSDWHDSVKTCLERIVPHLSLGGVLVIDDYFYWSGCRRAVDDYFTDKLGRYRFVRRQRLHIIREQ